MLGLESNHMKVEAYVKIENTSNQGHFSFNGHSIICQSVKLTTHFVRSVQI